MPWDSIVRLLYALLTPAIAIIAVYIAYQQHVTNRRQHRLALFERRMKVFDSTMNLIASILQDASVKLDQLFQFLRETRDHEFLFGPEISQYIDDLYRNGVQLRASGALLQRNPEEIRRNTDLLNWFSGQSAIAREKFLKYLDFTKP
jgi:hypothetical protein